jgi:hypothetical protein
MDEDLIKQINQEVDAMSINELHELGNQAISLGLIIGHGYRNNQYEILRRTEAILLSPKEARMYLKNLIDQVGG